MVYERGGLAAAKKLINDPQPADGSVRLYLVAFNTKYRSLFTPAERLAARNRYEYKGRSV
jgi:hypothetical protein